MVSQHFQGNVNSTSPCPLGDRFFSPGMAQCTPFEEWTFKNFLGEDPPDPPYTRCLDVIWCNICEGSTLWCTYTPTFNLLDIPFYVLLEATKICNSTPSPRDCATQLGRPKIRTFFRINARFWPTDLPIPLNIPANFFFLIPTNDALTLEYKWAKEDIWKSANFGTPYYANVSLLPSLRTWSLWLNPVTLHNYWVYKTMWHTQTLFTTSPQPWPVCEMCVSTDVPTKPICVPSDVPGLTYMCTVRCTSLDMNVRLVLTDVWTNPDWPSNKWFDVGDQ